jgi:pimeloyl-ACP methyl ester carboxylesterase
LVEIEKFFSKSEIRIIAGGGHAVHIEKFSEYNAIINEYLTKYRLTRN